MRDSRFKDAFLPNMNSYVLVIDFFLILAIMLTASGPFNYTAGVLV